jgi:hypothetical protein
MGCFAGALPLLREVRKVGGFVRGPLRHSNLAVSSQFLVEEAGHGRDQSTAGNFQLRRSNGSHSSSPRDHDRLCHSQRLVNDSLAGIFVDPIVGDKDRKRLDPPGGSGIEEPIRLGI